MPINIDILNTLIKNQREAIKYQTIFALIVFLLGVCLIVISSFALKSVGVNETLKIILSVGGGFISTTSAYPINQMITRKERKKTYEILLCKINELTEPELKRIEDIIWKSVEKII